MGGATRFLLLLATPFSFLRPRSSSFRRLGPLSLRPFSTTLPPHHTITLTPQHLTVKSSQKLHIQSNSSTDNHYPHHHHNNNHPWPEWPKLLQTLAHAAGVSGIVPEEDAFVSYEYLSEEFAQSANSCLAFARNRPDILGLLSRKDIEVVVENGTPFLFQSALDTGRRMRAFLGSTGSNVLESDKAQTVDLMKYLLCYASNPSVSSSEKNNLYSRELVESSARNLLSELVVFISRVPVSDLSTPEQHQLPGYQGQKPPFGQNIEMKKGDWICPRCSFMNFARNVKCLECEEARPKRQLTGREWECPQCDFYNYGRNTVCLRCDCKRPGEASFGTVNSRSDSGYNNEYNANKSDNRLAANEEKAQQMFSKVSQLNKTSDLGNANKSLDASPERSLDQILGRTSTLHETDEKTIVGQNTGTVRSTAPRSGSLQDVPPKGTNSGYVPFVPLPADRFAKKPQSSKVEDGEEIIAQISEADSSKSHDQRGIVSVRNESGKSGENFQLSENSDNKVQSQNKVKEQAEKSERWFNRVAELHNVPDLTNSISDEDFPEIMPMRRGENRFVVSKKKDRSLTSPMYKRQMAVEQASNPTFVPFVPFPPDYFAKKDKPQPESTSPAATSTDEASSISSRSSGLNHVKSDDARQGVTNLNQEANTENQQTGRGKNWSSDYSVNNGEPNSAYQTQSSQVINNDNWSSTCSGKDGIWRTGPPSIGSPSKPAFSTESSTTANWSSRYSGKENASQTGEPSRVNSTQNSVSNQPCSNSTGTTAHSPGNHNVKSGWTGKSLEGSAVKEPDPLDMSEEAKAERWFRRVAQIKDISELSQIPDEDFPSIMPMRKGVNRFVVSKRKTPLERRLTSPQYRRNLPIVSSDPVKKDDDSS